MPQFCNLEKRMFDGVGKYDIPEIKPVYSCDAKNWLGFNHVKSYDVKNQEDIGVHFFLHDYQFERVWNTPDKYIKYLSRFNCILSPDFSMYTDFPLAVQIYNNYRKHWLAAYWQENGITVIPTITWSTPDSFEWCFDGEPVGGVVAVSDVGCVRNKEVAEAFNVGYTEMLQRLQPSKILFYTHNINKEYPGNVRYIQYTNRVIDTVEK